MRHAEFVRRLVFTLRRLSRACGAVTAAFGVSLAVAQPAPLASIAFSNEVEASLVRALESLRTDGIKPALLELDAHSPRTRISAWGISSRVIC